MLKTPVAESIMLAINITSSLLSSEGLGKTVTNLLDIYLSVNDVFLFDSPLNKSSS